MKHLELLTAAVMRLGVVDGYQYLSASRKPIDLPSDIRLIIRERRASQLGSAIHDQFTLVVALRGDAWVSLDRHRILLRAGQVLLIHPGVVHGYDDAGDADVHWLFCGFHIGSRAAWETLRSTPLTLSPRLAEDLSALLADHFLAVERGKRHTPHSERLVAIRLLLAIEQLSAEAAHSGTRESDAGTADDNHPFIQRIVAHIGDHLEGSLSIAGIANALHVSPGHLRNEFRRLAGTGIGRYVRAARIRQACILLDTTDLGLAEISRRCGYDTTFSFSRAFKADKGVPPSVYRATFRPVT